MIDRPLSTFVKHLMPENQRPADNKKPVSMWMEMDRLNGQPEQTCVAIFRTTGCSWYNFTSCSMCGYFNDISKTVTEEDLMKQTDSIVHYLGNTRTLKIFTSGSFLDEIEMPPVARDYFFDSVHDRIDKLLVESRTEYVTKKTLEPIKRRGINARIAIGVESTNDDVIRKSVNKGSSFSKFVTAAETSKEMGFEVRSYLLLKPPFLSEKDSIEDCKKSIEMVAPYSTDISVNPMNIQKNTFVEYLWKRGLYRPPRLWSLANILLWANENKYLVVSYPTGGNRERGVHNDSPDEILLDNIIKCSLKQEFEPLREYVNSSDLGEYNETVEMEDTYPLQFDLQKFTLEMRSSRLSL